MYMHRVISSISKQILRLAGKKNIFKVTRRRRLLLCGICSSVLRVSSRRRTNSGARPGRGDGDGTPDLQEYLVLNGRRRNLDVDEPGDYCTFDERRRQRVADDDSLIERGAVVVRT